MRSTVRAWLWGVGLLALTVAASAAERSDAATTATRAARPWLEAVDAGRYHEAWSSAARHFRQSVSDADWTAAARSAREPLGALQSRTRIDAQTTRNLPDAPAGRYVVLWFESRFAHRERAIETVTLVRENERWRVDGYYIH